MDFMRKILSSPLTRRRGPSTASHSDIPSSAVVGNGTVDTLHDDSDVLTTVQPRYFGVELSELVSRDGTDVPRLLLKLAHSICTRGCCWLILLFFSKPCLGCMHRLRLCVVEWTLEVGKYPSVQWRG